MKSHFRHCTAAAVLSSACAAAFAFQPLITDDTGTQGAGGNQLEFSVNQDRERVAGDTTRIRTLPVVYTRGLTDALDVYVAANHVRVRSTVPGTDASGSGNAALGAKWRWYEDEASGTSFGFKPEVILPVGAAKEAAGLGAGRASFALSVLMTQAVPFGAIHANVAAGRDRFRESALIPDESTARISVAPVWDVGETWKLALDVGRERTNAGGSATRANFVELGAIYSPDKDLDLAFGIVRRTDDADPSTTMTSATLGVTWRFR